MEFLIPFIFEFSVNQKKRAVMFYHLSINTFWPNHSQKNAGN